MGALPNEGGPVVVTFAAKTVTWVKFEATAAAGANVGLAEFAAIPERNTTTYAYDTLGNLTTVTDALGNVTTMAYDVLGRKTGMVDRDMGTWGYQYDLAGNLTRQTDARGQRICFYYDALNRLTGKHYRSDDNCPASSNPPFNVRYAYDQGTYGLGRRTWMSDTISGSTIWTYDTRGRVTQEVKTINGGGSFTTGYTYDSLDRVVTTTYPDGEVVRNTYNGTGQPATLRSDTYSNYNYVSSASYTALGSMLTMAYGNTLTNTYDYYDTAAEIDLGTNRAYSFRLRRMWTNSDRLDLGYQYDNVGNVKNIADTSGATNETLTFTYDELDRLTNAVTSGSGQTPYNESYSYNPIGNMDTKAGVTYVYPTSGANSVQPHAARRVTGSGGTSKTIQIRAYSTPCYSSTGERAKMELWVNGSKIKTWTNVASSWTLYSQAATLSGDDQIEIVFPNDCSSGGYDRNLYVDYVVVDGRTLQAEGGAMVVDKGAGSAAFDGLNVIAGQQGVYWNAALRFVVGDKAYAACYDANGNMTCRVKDGKAYLHTYTEENRLATVNDLAAGQTTTFTYDGDGALVKKVVGSTTTYYVSAGYEKTGSVVTKYYYFGGQRVAMRVCTGTNGSCGTNGATSTLTYLHGDHLGSASLATNSSGTMVNSMRYMPYGTERPDGTMATDRRFTGQRYESGLGLYDYNARYYDPYLNRFIQADTIVPSPANPQSLNRYSYVLNSPLRYTDPSGYYSVEQIMKMFHTSSWEDVLSEFEANGNFAGKWGWLEILLRAEDGDTLWAGNQSGEGATFTRLIEGEFMLDEPNGSLSLYRGWGLHGAQYTAAFEIVHGCDFFLLFPNGPSSLNFNDEIRIPGTPREIFATSAYQHHPHTIFDMHKVDWNGIAIDGGGAIVGFIPTPLTQLLVPPGVSPSPDRIAV